MFASRINQKLKGNDKLGLRSSVDSSDVCRLVANAALRAVPSLVHPSSVFALIVSYYSSGEQRPENIDLKDFLSITRTQLFHDLATVLLSDEDAETIATAFSSRTSAHNVDAALFAATAAFSSDKDLLQSVAVLRRCLSKLVYSFDIHGEPQVNTAAALKISKVLSDMEVDGENAVDMLSVKELKNSIISLGINAVVGHDEGVDSPDNDENILDVRALHRHLRGSGSTKSAAKVTGAGGGVVSRRPSPSLTDLSAFLLDVIKDFLDPALAYSQSSGNALLSNAVQSKALKSESSVLSTYSSVVGPLSGPLSAFSTNYNRSNASASSGMSSASAVSGGDVVGFKANTPSTSSVNAVKRITRFEENNNTYNGVPQSVSAPENPKTAASVLLSPKPLPLSPTTVVTSSSSASNSSSSSSAVLSSAGASAEDKNSRKADRSSSLASTNDNNDDDDELDHFDVSESYATLPATNLFVSRKVLVQRTSVGIGSIESVAILPPHAEEADIRVYKEDGYEETDDLSLGAHVWVRRLRDVDIDEARKSSKASPPSIGVVMDVTVTIAKSHQLTQQNPSQPSVSSVSNVLAPAPLLDRFPSQRVLILEHNAPKVPASAKGRWIAAGTWPVKQIAIGGIKRTACLWYLESEVPIPPEVHNVLGTAVLPSSTPSSSSSQESSNATSSNLISSPTPPTTSDSAVGAVNSAISSSTTSQSKTGNDRVNAADNKRKSHRSRHRHSSRSGSRRRSSRYRFRRQDDYDSDYSYSDSEDYSQSEDERDENAQVISGSRRRRRRHDRDSSSESSFTSGDSDDSRSRRYHGGHHGRRSSRRRQHYRSGQSHRHRHERHFDDDKNGKDTSSSVTEGDVKKLTETAATNSDESSKQSTEAGGMSKTEDKVSTLEPVISLAKTLTDDKVEVKVDATAAVVIPSELFGLIVVDVIKVAELDSAIITGGHPLVARSWVEYAHSSAKDAIRSKADYDVGPNPKTAPADLGQRSGEIVWKSSTSSAAPSSSSSTITKSTDGTSNQENDKPPASEKEKGVFRGFKCKGDVITPIVRLVKSSGVSVSETPSKAASLTSIPSVFTQFAKKGVLIIALFKESKPVESTSSSPSSEEIGRIEVPLVDVIDGTIKEPSYFDIRAIGTAPTDGKKGKFIGSLYFSARWSPLSESETALEKTKHAVFLMKQHVEAKKRRTGGSSAGGGEEDVSGGAQVAAIAPSTRYLGDSGVDPNHMYWAQADSQLVEHEPVVASSVPLLPVQISADVPILSSVPSSTLSLRQCAMLDKLRTDYKDAFSSSLSVASKSLLPIAAACSSLDILGTGTLPAAYMPKAFKLSGLLIDAGTCDRLLRLLLELSGAHPLLLSKSSSFGSVLASSSSSLSSSTTAPGSPVGKRGGGLSSPPMSPSASATRKGPLPVTFQPVAASLADHGECIFFDHILLSDLMTIPNVAVLKTDTLRLASPTQQKNAAISATFTSIAATCAILRSQIRHRLRLYVAAARTISKTSNTLLASGAQLQLRFPPVKILSSASVSLSDAFGCLVRQVRILAESHKGTNGGARGRLLSSEFVLDEASGSSVLPLSLEAFGDALEDLGCVIRNSDLASMAAYHGAFLPGVVSSRIRDDGESAFVDALALTNDFSLPVGGEGAAVTIDAKSSVTMSAPIKTSPASEADVFSTLPFSSGEKVLRSTMRSCAYLLSHLDIESPFRAAGTVSIVGNSKAGKKWAADDRLIPLTAGALFKVLDETLVVSVDAETFARVVRRIRLGPALTSVSDESKKSTVIAKTKAASVISDSSINDVPVCAKKFLAAYCDFSEGEFADLALRLRAHAEAERRAEKASVSLLSGTSSKASFTSTVINAFNLCAGLASEALASSASSSSSSSVNTTSILNSTLSRRDSRSANTLLVVPGAPLGTLPSRLFARALAEANLPLSPLEAVLLARRYVASPTSPIERDLSSLSSSEGLDVSIRLGIVPGGFSVHYEPVMRLITTPGSNFSHSSVVGSSIASTAPQAGSSLDPNTVSFLMSFASDGQRVVISDVVRASLNASFSSQDVFGNGNNNVSSNEAPVIRVKQRSGSVSGSSLALEDSSKPLEPASVSSVAIISTPKRGPVPPMSVLLPQPTTMQLHQPQRRDALSFPFSAPSGDWGSDGRRNGGIEARPPRPPIKSSSSSLPSALATPTATPSRRARLRDDRGDRQDRKDGEEDDEENDRTLTKEEIASNAAAEKRLRDSLTALNSAAENGDHPAFSGSNLLTIASGDVNSRALKYTSTGRWCCTVCFFAANKPYSRICSMCDSDNPFAAPGGFQNARDETSIRIKKDDVTSGSSTTSKSVVISWVCPACAFDSPAGTLECLVCSLPLQPPLESALTTAEQYSISGIVKAGPTLEITDGADLNHREASSKKPVISIVSPVAAGGGGGTGGAGIFLPSPTPISNRPLTSGGPVESFHALNSSMLSTGSVAINSSSASMQAKAACLSDPWTSRRQRPAIVTVATNDVASNVNNDNFVSILNASMYTTTKELSSSIVEPVSSAVNESFPILATSTPAPVASVATPVVVNSPALLPPRPATSTTPAQQTPTSLKKKDASLSDVDKKLMELEQRSAKPSSASASGSSSRERLSDAKTDLARSRMRN